MKAKVAATALFLLLLTFGGEAKICHDPSQTFKGMCLSNSNCISSCISEDYTGGYCGGVIDRKCMCTKECDDAPPPLPLLPAPKSGRRRPPPRAPGVTTTIE
ncbi:defensin J1-2-like [Oryza glaberrima]|uniref:defensin J1-2-like n=1 Tax=Oryza glaberrima TaxID=4538 RepID=UPI00023E16C2|nr:defensin J1-2-like [Oryza glaberrima]